MRPLWLGRLCELQLYALIFALPFEYYFGAPDQSFYTSLKLQLVLLIATWMSATLARVPGSGLQTLEEVKRVIPGRVMLATASFVVVQILAAALAPEFRSNAVKAAGKTCLGALVLVIVADLIAASEQRHDGDRNAAIRPLWALSLSGTCMALLGLGELAGSGLLARIVRLFQPSDYFLGDHVRLSSTMEYPNTAGSYLSASTCASLALLVIPRTGQRPGTKWAWFVMATIQGLALTMTYSRGALLSTLIAIAAATWAFRAFVSTRQKKLVLAACLAVLPAGVAVQCLVHHDAEAGRPPSAKRVARYRLEDQSEVRFLRPDHAYHEFVAVENDAPFIWRHGEYGIAYRWSRLSDDQILPLVPGAPFHDDVAPGQRVQVPVSLMTPVNEGEFLLIWSIFGGSDEIQEVKDSYAPAILCVLDSAGASARKDLSEKAQRYLRAIRKERQDLHDLRAPRRAELWSASLRMLERRPLLGMGPDNFRLVKWKFMDSPKGDETILANSFYLETLSGSGILGLAAFLWLIWECCHLIIADVPLVERKSGGAASYFGFAYLAGFLSHGFVDYFLKFTPTFLLFWLTLGMITANAKARQRSKDADCL